MRELRLLIKELKTITCPFFALRIKYSCKCQESVDEIAVKNILFVCSDHFKEFLQVELIIDALKIEVAYV